MTLICLLICLFVFIVSGLWMIRRKKSNVKPTLKLQKTARTIITSQDIKAIAGDNVMSTQLDLARAYIELGKAQLAKKILEHVIMNGDATQQHEAEQLISALDAA